MAGPAGVFPDIPEDAYHADAHTPEPSLSAGQAWDMIASSPAHVFEATPRLNPPVGDEEEDEPKFDIGRAAHMMLTGKGASIHRVEADNWRTKAAKDERIAARREGFTPLLAKDHDATMEMVRAARDQLRAHGVGDPFEGGMNEASLFWQAGGVWNRCRPDCMADNAICYDLKTTRASAAPGAWERFGAGAGLWLRVAHYLDGLDTLAPAPRPWRYRFIVQETEPPFALVVREATEGAKELGARQLRDARALWRECLDAARWPGYPAEIVPIGPHEREMERWLDTELQREDARKRAPSRRAIDTMLEMFRPARTA